MESLCAEHLLADKGYDSDAIEDWAKERGLVTIILPRKNRKVNGSTPLTSTNSGALSKTPFLN
jgi:IS5 family transposase